MPPDVFFVVTLTTEMGLSLSPLLVSAFRCCCATARASVVYDLVTAVPALALIVLSYRHRRMMKGEPMPARETNSDIADMRAETVNHTCLTRFSSAVLLPV